METIVENKTTLLAELRLGDRFEYTSKRYKVIGIKTELLPTDVSSYSSRVMYSCEDENKVIIDIPSTTAVYLITIKFD